MLVANPTCISSTQSLYKFVLHIKLFNVCWIGVMLVLWHCLLKEIENK